MSLQVWLPLNGNLNNQGLSEVTVTNNGATVDSNGKIGSCYSFDGGADRVSISDPLPFTEDLTMMAWIKPTNVSSTTTQYALSYNTDTGGTSGHLLGIGMYGSSALAVWCSGTVFTPGVTLVDNTWYHVAASRARTGELKVYVNGSCILTSVDSNAPASRWFTIGGRSNSATGGAGGVGYCFKGSINDVRLYDHCLSAKEVKEISKGLIGHWKLDNNGFGNPNLINTDNPLQAGGRTVVTDKKLIISATDTTADTYFTIKLAEAIQADVEYTLSCGVEDMNCNTNWNFPLFAQGNPISKTLVISPNASKASITFTVPTGSSYVGTTIIFMDDGGRPSTNPNDITLSNFKLEKGSVATHWCPHTSDNMYTLLGLDSSAEVDCSGLSNNGTKIGGLTPSTSPVSIRYESCYDFDGNTGSIQIPNLATLAPSGEFTMNCWIYHDDTWSSKGYETILGGPNNTFELEAKVTSTNSPVLYAYSWGQGKATYELNKWNMITMTRNASESKFYINGELKITGTAGTIPPGNYFMGAWRSSSEQNYKGKISDFRLYSNVLSVEDIQELYNTSASVDKNGNMYAYEFKEE